MACYLTATPFVVVELCESGSLDKFLRQEEKSERRASAIELLLQAAHGLASIHSQGIVHGDLKCDNILVMGKATIPLAKVCSFEYAFDWNAMKKRVKYVAGKAAARVEISEAIKWLAPSASKANCPAQRPMSTRLG